MNTNSDDILISRSLRPAAHPNSSSSLKGDSNGHIRVLIVGNSGVGKSTTASKLANILNAPLVRLDELYWQPNWGETPDNEFRELVTRFIRENHTWVIDGNYERVVGDLTFDNATDIVWLDPPFALYFPRLVLRTLLRLFRLDQPCSAGCDETLSDVLTWGEKSILWWAWNHHTPLRELCSNQMQEDKHGKWIRLGGWGDEVNTWLTRVAFWAKER